MAPKRQPSSWDPVLIISQIVSIQTLHYLTLSIITPPCLAMLTDKGSLMFDGGPASVGMIMDWREMAGSPTMPSFTYGSSWNPYAGAYSRKEMIGTAWQEGQWNGRIDPMRGWTVAFCWILASSADIYYLFYIIRRPRLILDFALTFLLNHVVLTTYYSACIPTSIFFWLVMITSSALTIVIAEQICVKREMQDGLVFSLPRNTDGVEEGEVEMSDVTRRA